MCCFRTRSPASLLAVIFPSFDFRPLIEKLYPLDLFYREFLLFWVSLLFWNDYLIPLPFLLGLTSIEDFLRAYGYCCHHQKTTVLGWGALGWRALGWVFQGCVYLGGLNFLSLSLNQNFLTDLIIFILDFIDFLDFLDQTRPQYNFHQTNRLYRRHRRRWRAQTCFRFFRFLGLWRATTLLFRTDFCWNRVWGT